MGNNWKFHHVAVVVRDMDKAVEYYQSLGIGIIEPEFIDAGCKFRNVQMGSMILELVQPIEGESAEKEFLNKRGEGVHHIGYSVDDFDKETAKLAEKGVSIIIGGKIPTGGGWAYFDTRKGGNVIIELIQWGK